MNRLHLAFAFLAALSSGAVAQTTASGSMSFTQNGSLFTYDISLRNTGTTGIGTLWYAWIPGQDYLPVPPTSFSSPTGWTAKTTTSAGFGTAIQWVAGTGVTLAAGGILDGFTFTTPTTPTDLAGLSMFNDHATNPTPVGTSFVYQGAPFSGGSSKFVIAPTPEPATLAALGLGMLGLVRRRARR